MTTNGIGGGKEGFGGQGQEGGLSRDLQLHVAHVLPKVPAYDALRRHIADQTTRFVDFSELNNKGKRPEGLIPWESPSPPRFTIVRLVQSTHEDVTATFVVAEVDFPQGVFQEDWQFRDEETFFPLNLKNGSGLEIKEPESSKRNEPLSEEDSQLRKKATEHTGAFILARDPDREGALVHADVNVMLLDGRNRTSVRNPSFKTELFEMRFGRLIGVAQLPASSRPFDSREITVYQAVAYKRDPEDPESPISERLLVQIKPDVNQISENVTRYERWQEDSGSNMRRGIIFRASNPVQPELKNIPRHF